MFNFPFLILLSFSNGKDYGLLSGNKVPTDYLRINIRKYLDNLALFKRFLKSESIFTNEYDNSESYLCGFNNQYFISNESENLWLMGHSDFTDDCEEYLNIERDYAKKNKDKIVFLFSCTLGSGKLFKLEIPKNDYELNKNEILKRVINRNFFYEDYIEGMDDRLVVEQIDDLDIQYKQSKIFVNAELHSYS